MNVEKFLKSFDYQEGTTDDDIRVTVDCLGKLTIFALSEWKKQPYYIIKSKIINWRVDVEDSGNGKTNIYIEIFKTYI